MNMIDPCMFAPVDENNTLAVWEVTRRCELKCPHCCSKAGNAFLKNGYNDISEEEAMRILRMIRDEGYNMLYISGGEPLLWPHLIPIIRQALAYGIQCYIATSGYSQNADTLSQLMPLPFEDFHVSLDSYCAEKHDKFRGVPGAFDKAVEFIKLCKKHNKTVVTSSIISPDLIEHIDEMLELLSQIGVDRAAFNFLVPLGRAGLNGVQIIPTEDKIRIANGIRQKSERYHLPITINRIHEDQTLLKECPAGKYMVHINSDGSVSPCSWVGKLWDDMTKKPDQTLFDEELLSTMRIRFRKITNDKCGACEHSLECGKGCPIIAYFESQKYDKICGF